VLSESVRLKDNIGRICFYKDAGAAVGQGGAVKGLRTMPTYKKKQQKNRYQ